MAKNNGSNLPSVPQQFVSVLEVVLQKLVGAGQLRKDLIGPDFFFKIRVKFNNATKKVF